MTPNALLSAGVLIHFGEPDWNLKSLVNAARCPLKGGDLFSCLDNWFLFGKKNSPAGPSPKQACRSIAGTARGPGRKPTLPRCLT